MIPRTIHFVWIGPEMPEWGRRNIREFRRLNPEHEVRVHGEEVLLDCFRQAYGMTVEPCSKADLLRYSALERFGGWYFDVDYWPFRPVCDAERAWALDGKKLFLARCWKDDANPGAYGNGVLASGDDCTVWPVLHEMVADTARGNVGRLTFGPAIMRELVRREPYNTVVADLPWFNGVRHPASTKLYLHMTRGGSSDAARAADAHTGGQLPFAMHLWAWKHGRDLDAGAIATARKPICVFGEGAPLAAVSVLPGYNPDSPNSVFTGIARGLAGCGHRVEIVPHAADALDHCTGFPAVVVVWNSLREPQASVVAHARRIGARVLVMEHGFWQRNRYVQVDPVGTQHRASWASRLREPAPPEGAERLARFYPDGVVPVRARKKGYVLVLGQVPRDSQLWDSEIQGPLPLQRAVKAALPPGVQVCFRPHPQCSNVRLPAHKRILPTLSDDPSEAQAYRASKNGTGLAAALAGARFVVTINSTAGNEALAAGVPVLAFGPALYTMAGVARQTTVKALKEDLAAMLNGWGPEQSAVENYLRWLAARQWTAEELARGGALRDMLPARRGLKAEVPANVA